MPEFLFYLLVFMSFFAVLLVIYNNIAIVKKYKIKTEKVSKSYRLVVVSDFHNKKYNRDNTYIIEKIKAQKPDIIIVSGDLVDRRRPDFECSKKFLSDLRGITETYYVTGNHEADLGVDAAVKIVGGEEVLLDERYKIFSDISILGISDRLRDLKTLRTDELSVFQKLDNFKIVIVHRPSEFYDNLCIKDYDIDLVISGHSHGGAVRMPFFGAIFSPDEGFFPKYTKGRFTKNGTLMIVSGGLGNTFLPNRINNFPEIVVIDIEN